MKDKIRELCTTLEKERGIKILFAVENGSRAWRMESKDSDYDVRFVFTRHLNEYVQINRPAEGIEKAFDKELRPHPMHGSFIDMVGFDIFKFIKMLSSSNPTTIEWLVSDVVYYGKQNPTLKKFATQHFNKIALYHHYKSMCRNNYLKYLKSGGDVTYKRYLYAFRGLLNAKWVEQNGSIPPISFLEVVQKSKNLIPAEIRKRVESTIAIKAQGREHAQIKNISAMDQYIEKFLKDDSDQPQERSHTTLQILNDELRNIVLNP